jgi:hypothetical protein
VSGGDKEDSVLVNAVETFAQLKEKIADKLGLPVAQIQTHSGPDTDMTKVHDDMRVVDIFPQGGTIYIDNTASGSSNSQQQGSGNTPESAQTSTYTHTYTIGAQFGNISSIPPYLLSLMQL